MIPRLAVMIESTLTAEGYHCECALDGQIGADCIEEKVYDLILLDLMLPQISGYELHEYIVTVRTPVIIISAMGQAQRPSSGDFVGMRMIYLSKPFQIGELLARVETVLRRTKRIQDKITIDDVTLDPVSRQVFKDGHQINLTVKEFDLLMELVGNKNVALSRARLYEAVWEEEYSGETRTLDSHIQRLRKKLDWNDPDCDSISHRIPAGGSSVKFFYKIFLSMLLVLTVSLATIEYLTVSYSLEHALQREENTALSQHQMAKYSIQTVLLG